jgi:hypothetical protein
LGGGWVAEEALAIGVYCALKASNFEEGVVLAVNHNGDSDSTGLIAGHMLGAMRGLSEIPARWLATLELRNVIEELADDLATVGAWPLHSSDDPDTSAEMEYYLPKTRGNESKARWCGLSPNRPSGHTSCSRRREEECSGVPRAFWTILNNLQTA